MKVVIIGAVAAGPKAGCRIKRLMSQAQVTMLDRDDIISYGGCGIPFYVSGDVGELKGLLSTSFHMVRDPEFFHGAKGIEVLAATEAVSIDPAAKVVRVRPTLGGEERELAYDKLIIATGSKPFVPPVPGVDLPGVVPVANMHHAETIKNLVTGGQVGTAVVVGAGATGLEMAEALNDLWGIEVHIIEAADRVLPGVLDSEISAMVQHHLSKQEDLYLHLNTSIDEIIGDAETGVSMVKADGQEIEADLVIMATGVRPNVDLAVAAGLELADNGAIKVDDHMRTSDQDIFAAGDCVSYECAFTGGSRYIPAGSLANRSARVAGSNVCGADDTFGPVVGSFCIKLFGFSAAHTGLNQEAAAAAGLDCVAPLVVQADRAHFHPDMAMMYVKLVVERSTRRIIGFSAVGENGDAVVGRVNAVAGLLQAGAKLEALSNLELAYSPPLGAAVDIVNAAANAAENLLDDKLRPIGPEEFSRRLSARDSGQTVFLDMRTSGNAAPYLEALSPAWVHMPQETIAEHLDQVPRDTDVVLVCNSGVRSYEAQVILDAAGINNTFNLAGGVAAAKLWGEPIIPATEDKED